MDITKRFIPELCPGCQARIEARYSAYRHSPAHVLFYPLLIGGVVLLVVLTAYLFWATAKDAIELLDALGVRHRKDRGLAFFLLLALTVPIIVWVARKWWKYLHRLPREFSFECPACHWTGPVKVIDLAGVAEPPGSIQIQIDSDDMPGVAPDPLNARRERQQRRSERRHIREQEHEQPPNPDFDFRDK